MITELKKVDSVSVGGKTIEVIDYQMRNFRLHQVMEQISRLLLNTLECDSNNTNAQAVPSEVREIQSQWSAVKKEFEFALKHNDFPQGAYEYAYTVSVIHGREVQRVRNVKLKRIVSEIYNACKVLVFCDSASTQGYISAGDAANISKIFSLVDDALALWVGTGEVGKDGTTDLGLAVPAFIRLGELQPDIDSDFSVKLEPSRSYPVPAVPDIKDVE